jgi:hypothetical protein
MSRHVVGWWLGAVVLGLAGAFCAPGTDEVATCDPRACDATCQASGARGGLCEAAGCRCVGGADADADADGDADADADDASGDVEGREYDDEFWGDGTCGGEEIGLTRLPTNLVFVVDRSSSMLDPSDPAYTPTTAELGSCSETNAAPATGIGYTTRWDDVVASVNGVVADAADTIRFGLTLFPGPGALSGAEDPATMFCGGTATPVTTVPPALGAGDAIAGSLADADSMPICSGGFTPVHGALLAARVALDSAAEPGPGVLVLATDGAPNCNGAAASGCTCTTGMPFCDGTLGTIGCLDEDRTLGLLGELAAAGYRTYVVGIPGSETFADLLDRMADQGGTARAGSPRHYRVENRAELAAALGTISAGEESCRFELGSVPPDTTLINVLVDDRPLRRDDPAGDGFSYDGTTNTVELRGEDCAALRAGTIARVRFLFGCPPLL